MPIPELDAFSGSWIVINNATGASVCELWGRGAVEKVNLQKYSVLTAYQYLTRFNALAKIGCEPRPLEDQMGLDALFV